jgi:hypothetical protein
LQEELIDANCNNNPILQEELIDAGEGWIKANAGQIGIYRVSYSPELLSC